MTFNFWGKVGGSPRPFNTFFQGGLLLLLLTGCATTPEAKQAKEAEKDVSIVRLFTELRDESMVGTKVSLPRSNPMEIAIDKEPFADERDVARADVVKALGGFAIRIEMTQHGRMTLEGASVSRAGLKLVIFGQWTTGKEATVQRWLGGPVMRRALRDGVIVFTPDCDKEEADRFVRGLNNVAIKLENQPKPKKTKDAAKKPAQTEKQKKKEAAKARSEKPSGAADAINSFKQTGQ